MTGEMTTWDMLQWRIYFQAEPFGPYALNLGLGKLMALMANIFGGKKARKISGEHMALGYYPRTGVKESTGSIKRKLKAIAQAFKKKSKKGEQDGS
jgi:hypothetical protein